MAASAGGACTTEWQIHGPSSARGAPTGPVDRPPFAPCGRPGSSSLRVSRWAGGQVDNPLGLPVPDAPGRPRHAGVREDQPGAPGYGAIDLGGAVMQIRLPPDLAECARTVRTPMTVDEFLAHFPEVPPDLRDEPVLGEYVRAFGLLLRVAQKPTPCIRNTGDHQHVFYTRLVNDLAILSPASASPSGTGRWRGFEPSLISTSSSPPRSRAHWCPRKRGARPERAAPESAAALLQRSRGGAAPVSRCSCGRHSLRPGCTSRSTRPSSPRLLGSCRRPAPRRQQHSGSRCC